MTKQALVVSAHSADFVFRAGGAIALYAQKGFKVTVIALSYGERGESAKLWRQPGMTLERVKTYREAEAIAAADILGIHDIQFWDLGDCPLILGSKEVERLASVYRSLRPAFVLTHHERDLHNHDHVTAGDLTQHARILAQAHGHDPDVPVVGATPVYTFEPQQTEISGWTPSLLLDIGPVWAKKRAAIECMTGQEHLWDYYTRIAQQRGAQAARNSDRAVAWGEAYRALFPGVADTLGIV